MTFTAPNAPATVASPTNATVTNYSFFPNLELADFYSVMRVDSVAGEVRAKVALELAMLKVNADLITWMQTYQANGVTAISSITEAPGLPAGAGEKLYLRAVYSLAKADLNEQLNDYARQKSTGDEEENADSLRRNAAWAISDLVGRPRTTVELI